MSQPTLALAGGPNVGKSTLFNALTGAQASVGNWPGTSVECQTGQWAVGSQTMSLTDLPGAYSLDAISPDEQLVADVLLADPGPLATIVLVDANHLARSLYLVAQLREQASRMVVAVTMADLAARAGLVVDAGALGQAIGAPAVIVDPRHGSGLADLATAVQHAIDAPPPPPRAIDDDRPVDDDRFAWAADVVELATSASPGARLGGVGDRVDKLVTGPRTGPLIFLVAMWAVFQATTTIASPLQGLLSRFFSGPFSQWALDLLGLMRLGGSWVQGLVLDGLIAGVGTLLSFVPLMAVMFVLLALLEDSGYMARAAVVTDTLMRHLGLPGQAFLPLVVGFGCNVPAVAATRILPRPRQRMLTALLVPFTSCSARLSVYLLLGSVFYGRWAGTVVFAMYVCSILLVVVFGLVLRATLWRDMDDPPLVLDLPAYQRPTWAVTFSSAWQRLKGFLATASGIIVGAVVVVWFLQAIPLPGAVGGFGHVSLDDSLYAGLARAITPVFHWTGFGAWQLVSALIIGFVAKEAVVSSLGQTFASADATAGLPAALHHMFNLSSGGHQLAGVAAFLVFVLAYTPCAATIATLRREIGGRWTSFGVASQLLVAWVLAVLVFQIGCLL